MSTKSESTPWPAHLPPLDEKKRDALLQHFHHGVVALDVETTGLSPLIDEIIELSAVKVTPQGTQCFSSLIKPNKTIPQETIDIHGITNDMVKDARPLDKVLPRFMTFMGQLPLLAHNAKFDMGHLIFAFHHSELPFPSNEAYCTILLSRLCLPETPNHKLGTLSEYLEIPLKNQHRALDDAYACLWLAAECLKKNVPDSLKKSYQYQLSDFSEDKLTALPKRIAELKEAVKNGEIIEMLYSGGSHKNEWRGVKTTSLLPMPAGNVLYGLCLITNLYKSFAVRKIKAIREPDEKKRTEYRERIKTWHEEKERKEQEIDQIDSEDS